MGVVYRATDPSLERAVALKLVAPELSGDERFRARFLREPRLAASLEHPNVVPIYEAGEREGQLFLAMRYVGGSDLRSVLADEGRLSPERALALLGQVAGALDAAHGRGLVHRDVKPANVLLDESEHVYLTDFGVTKQLGGDSTDTGQLVGTLDYLAPEQIRGEPVDARSDVYALGCVLYECLAGRPPFRRESEAETLWAHMQDEPPPLPRYPRLDPVLRKALAKDKGARQASCGELIDQARDALGLAAPPAARGPRLPAGLVRRRRAIAAAGAAVLGLAMVAAVVVLALGGNETGAAPVGNGVAAIGPDGGKVDALIESSTAPSNIAVGEGAVWVLNTQNKTVSRIDPKTKVVTKRFTMPGFPTDIAAGQGAVWVGNSARSSIGNGFTASISRVDPQTGKVTHTEKLPDRTGAGALATFNWGVPDIAPAQGAVWAKNPDATVSRLDAETGRLVATIDVDANLIAAGPGGVWVDDGDGVRRVNTRTNRLGRRIPVATADLSSMAVGAGKIWGTDDQQGVVWRIDPGPAPVARTIDVGVGVTYIAFGEGAVWTANYLDGMVSKIDPRTNKVTDRIPVGAAQAIAAGAGSAWVSTAGGAEAGTLPASACGAVTPAGTKPDVLIASDMPLQGPQSAAPEAIADAIRHVISQRDYRAGRYTVGYSSCDDSTAQTGGFENRKCAANANAYARADRLVAVIGTYNSDCAAVEIPILNKAPGGPLAMISPMNTWQGLTRSVQPAIGRRGEPDVYYPTGRRNFVRVAPDDDLLAAADAILAKRLGIERVYVVDDGSDLWKVELSSPFRKAARKLGVGIAGSATFDPRAERYDALAERIARSGAGAVVLGADPFNGGDRVVRALRKRLGSRVKIMAGFFFTAPVPDVLKRVGPAAHGIYVSTSDLPRGVMPLSPAGRRFAAEIGESARQNQGVIEAGQATELVLDAIARSDGTRESVLKQLRASRVRNGILGSFGFDANGDMTTAAVPVVRLTGSTPPGAGMPTNFQGAVLDRVVVVPTRLVK
jgi:ABC-type branched-subunit amino acid transport system substrate-binding protein/DNA-binding beta-propeller fold protein YncE